MFTLQTNTNTLHALEYKRQDAMIVSNSARAISSGVRIHCSAVDPSGLAIAEGMRARIGGLNTAAENIQDDIRMIQVADGTLSEMHDILMRIRDLAVRSANQAVFNDQASDAANKEIKALANELTRIINASDYNTKQLFQDVLDDDDTSNGEYSITDANAGQIAAFGGQESYDRFKQKVLDMLAPAIDKSFEYLGVQKNLYTPLTVSIDFSYAGPAAATGGGGSNSISLQINLSSFSLNDDEWLSKVLAHEMGHAITIGEGASGADATSWKDEMLAQYVSQEINDRIPDGALAAEIAGALNGAVGLTNSAYARVALAGQYIYETHGRDKWVDIVDYVRDNGGTYDGDNGAIVTVLGYADWASFEAAVDAYSTAANASGSVKSDGVETFSAYGQRQMRFNIFDLMQVGADNSSSNSYNVSDAQTFVDFRFLAGRSFEVAQRAITNSDAAINSVSSMRGQLGVQQRRLMHSLDDLKTETINITQARSVIFDADIAQETTTLTKAQILQQSNQAALAQANIINRTVLDLMS